MGVLKNFAKFTGKLLCQSLFFNKVAGLMAATLLKNRLWNSLPIECFPLNYNINGFKSGISRHLLTVGSF